jgi:hypothetical protein
MATGIRNVSLKIGWWWLYNSSTVGASGQPEDAWFQQCSRQCNALRVAIVQLQVQAQVQLMIDGRTRLCRTLTRDR